MPELIFIICLLLGYTWAALTLWGALNFYREFDETGPGFGFLICFMSWWMFFAVELIRRAQLGKFPKKKKNSEE